MDAGGRCPRCFCTCLGCGPVGALAKVGAGTAELRVYYRFRPGRRTLRPIQPFTRWEHDPGARLSFPGPRVDDVSPPGLARLAETSHFGNKRTRVLVAQREGNR